MAPDSTSRLPLAHGLPTLRAPMIKFDAVTLRRGPRVLFAEASFSLFRGEKVGITGENGSGKSSLHGAGAAASSSPDAGHFEMPDNLAVAHVAQELDATDQPAIEFVLDGDAELRELRTRIAAAEADADHDGTRLANLYTRVRQQSAATMRARAPRS